MQQTVNEINDKGTLDKGQEYFYKKRSDIEKYIFSLFFVTLALAILGLFLGSVFNNLLFYLVLPFCISLALVAITSMFYFISSIYFRKRIVEKRLEKPKNFKEKSLKFGYSAVKYLIGMSFLWTLVGDFILTIILGKPVQLIADGYNQFAVKLFIFSVLLALSYCVIIFFNFTASLIGFGDAISERDSVFNLYSKRSFVMFLGGYFICVTMILRGCNSR